MERKTRRVSVAVTVLVLAILACQPGPAPAPTFIVTVQLVTPPTSTLTFQTATPVIASPTLVPIDFEVTLPPTLTTIPSTDTLIPSPTIPLVSVSTATNCRTGPGRVYDRVMVVDVGVTYEVIGKYTPDNYWVINLLNGGQCWLWGQYALIAGNVNSVPEMIPPPPPTPALGGVTGTITNSFDGSKVSNALVTALRAKLTFTTSSDGTYHIGNLPGGQEFITVVDGSHRARFQSVNVTPGNTVVVDFTLNPEFISSFLLTVEGTVYLNSSPAAGVNVSVWSRNASAITDSDGRYRIEFQGRSFTSSYLILAEYDNLSGAVEANFSNGSTLIAPDIILLPRQ